MEKLEIIRPLPVTQCRLHLLIEGSDQPRGCIIPVIKPDDLLGKQLSEMMDTPGWLLPFSK